MWSPSSHSTGSPQDGRARSSTDPACRDVATARAPPRPLVGRLAVGPDVRHCANTQEDQ
jgi:hypothetical protein